MRKRQSLIFLFLILLFFIFTGCGNQRSFESKSYKKEVLTKYKERANELLSQSLTTKYNQKVTITSLNIIANLDYSLGLGSEPYKKVATGKARIDEDEFDIYLKWDIKDDPENFICCDNREKEEILNDLEKYFEDLYGCKPYTVYFEVFSSCGYEFKAEDGMIVEKYNGNIEDYINNFGELIKIAVAYEDIDTIFIKNTVNEQGEIAGQTLNELLTAKNIYIFNTFDNTLSNKDLKSIISGKPIDKFFPLVKEYIHIEKGSLQKWTNTMTEFAQFTYKGSVTDKTLLVDDDCGLNIQNWKTLPINDILNYEVVSNWYYTPEKNAIFYIYEDSFSMKSSKYTVLFCHKSSDDNAKYSFEVIPSDNIGYIMVKPNTENTWFIICAKEDTTPEFIKKFNEYWNKFIESIGAVPVDKKLKKFFF